MTKKEENKFSKLLSLVLRHQPEAIGLTLDSNGWADCQVLLDQLHKHGNEFNLQQLKRVVENNSKKRFIFSPDFLKIRANQGHSIPVDLELMEQPPPSILFHGTAEKNLESIQHKGLIKGERNHVHLSDNKEIAKGVGQRYGKPIVLNIKAHSMHQEGIPFYQSENKVWLTDYVDPKFIEFPK